MRDRSWVALVALVAIVLVRRPRRRRRPSTNASCSASPSQGRPIRVVHRGDPDEIRVLVVGCIHGDECAGVRIARPPANRSSARLPRPVDRAEPEPRRPRRAHAAERARRGPEPQLPVPLAARATRSLLPGPAPRVRTRDADRDAPDPADRARHHDLVPPAARARRRVGRRAARAPLRSPGRPPTRPPRPAPRDGDLVAEARPATAPRRSWSSSPAVRSALAEPRVFARAVYRLVEPR